VLDNRKDVSFHAMQSSTGKMAAKLSRFDAGELSHVGGGEAVKQCILETDCPGRDWPSGKTTSQTIITFYRSWRWPCWTPFSVDDTSYA